MLNDFWRELVFRFEMISMELSFWLSNYNAKIGVLVPVLFILMFFLYNIRNRVHKETKLFWAAVLVSVFIGCLTSYRHDFMNGIDLYTSVRIFCFFPLIFLILAKMSKSPSICENTECLPFYFFSGTFVTLVISDIYSAYSIYKFGYLSGIGGAGIYDGLVITPLVMSFIAIIYSESKKSELAKSASRLKKAQESSS